MNAPANDPPPQESGWRLTLRILRDAASDAWNGVSRAAASIWRKTAALYERLQVGPRLGQFAMALRRCAAWPGYLEPRRLVLQAIVWGFVGNVLLFYGFNSLLRRRIDSACKGMRLEILGDSRDASQIADQFVKKGVCDVKIRDWVKDAFSGTTDRMLAVDRAVALANKIVGQPNQGSTIRSRLLTILAGRRQGGWLWIDAELPTASALYDAVADNPSFDKALKDEKDSALKKQCLEKFLGAMAKQAMPEIRPLLVWNGGIQWLIGLSGCTVLVIAVWRGALAWRIGCWSPGASNSDSASRAAGGNPLQEFNGILETVRREAASNPAAGDDAIRREHERVLRSLDREVYALAHHFVGLLPALGFIGTILGMGEALLEANALFGAGNAEDSVAKITQQLGMAFDTTYVGLIWSIPCGLALSVVHVWEVRGLKSVMDKIRAASVEGAAAEPAP